jgi:FtsH-binding integral membrane protein
MQYSVEPERRRRLTLGQTMILQGVIPIVLVGLVLPVGITAFFLAIENAPARAAIEHGELFLAAGNSAFTGCIILASSRYDSPYAVGVTLVVLLAFVFPAYGGWAVMTVQDILHKPYSVDIATVWGTTGATVAAIIALVFVRLSYRPG